jgi:hypothetical protein
MGNLRWFTGGSGKRVNRDDWQNTARRTILRSNSLFFKTSLLNCAAGGRNTNQVLPLVAGHLEVCVECREELEALMQISEVLGQESRPAS